MNTSSSSPQLSWTHQLWVNWWQAFPIPTTSIVARIKILILIPLAKRDRHKQKLAFIHACLDLPRQSSTSKALTRAFSSRILFSALLSCAEQIVIQRESLPKLWIGFNCFVDVVGKDDARNVLFTQGKLNRKSYHCEHNTCPSGMGSKTWALSTQIWLSSVSMRDAEAPAFLK